ncbi:hypothetical protein BB561_004494 [Smittium simulii]|uniref:GATA-type domain-containing protein n=1 Tax=Smittium simulii TaxID=133385 RepID=A0A2T9YFZ1_9FUNG|nr:hypothetical protein BB561_004494 [Smittium simulii]
MNTSLLLEKYNPSLPTKITSPTSTSLPPISHLLSQIDSCSNKSFAFCSEYSNSLPAKKALSLLLPPISEILNSDSKHSFSEKKELIFFPKLHRNSSDGSINNHELVQISHSPNYKDHVPVTDQHRKKKGSIGTTFCTNCKTIHTPLWRRNENNQQVCNACGLYQKSYNKTRPIPERKLKLNQELLAESIINSSNTSSLYSVPSPNKTIGNRTRNTICPGNGECNGLGGGPTCSGCPTFNQQLIQNGSVLLDRRVRLKKNASETICFNCKAVHTPLWRRDDNMNVICNACGLYYKLHKEHRPISMKKNIIKRRSRTAVSASCKIGNKKQKSSLSNTLKNKIFDNHNQLSKQPHSKYQNRLLDRPYGHHKAHSDITDNKPLLHNSSYDFSTYSEATQYNTPSSSPIMSYRNNPLP